MKRGLDGQLGFTFPGGVGRLKEEDSVWRRRGWHEDPVVRCKACLGTMGEAAAKRAPSGERVGLWKALHAKLMNLNLISQILESSGK